MNANNGFWQNNKFCILFRWSENWYHNCTVMERSKFIENRPIRIMAKSPKLNSTNISISAKLCPTVVGQAWYGRGGDQ